MTVSTIEESELPEYQTVFTLNWNTTPNSTTVVELCAAGHHPKCRISRGQVTPLVYATGAQVIAIEDGGGTDAATCTGSTTVFTPTVLTLVADQYFERNESINGVITTVGSTTNTCHVAVQLESIH